MKKQLATITILCFFNVVNADIYVCESEISGDILAPIVLQGSYTKKEGATYFIVDTESGVRESNGNRHTVEPCQISDEFLICMSLFEGIGMNSFAIDTTNYAFTYVEQNYRVRITSYYGTCIKGS
tara:strand:+ start:761 stop:1135 length:375 start_codon:yes stop_codon:yes gene_type:complete